MQSGYGLNGWFNPSIDVVLKINSKDVTKACKVTAQPVYVKYNPFMNPPSSVCQTGLRQEPSFINSLQTNKGGELLLDFLEDFRGKYTYQNNIFSRDNPDFFFI